MQIYESISEFEPIPKPKSKSESRRIRRGKTRELLASDFLAVMYIIRFVIIGEMKLKTNN